jgi:predicted enzyme involved in methoxymalonyl-ACP biosynthesis
LQAFLDDGGQIFAFEVTDSFTAYGLVGVVLLQGSAIMQWVMSCRVLGYQIEQAIMATIVNRVRGDSDGVIEGTLIETGVNFPCRSLFANCGFTQDGTQWHLADGIEIALPSHVTVRTTAQ